MGSDDEFGPDTETIRAWLSKRATYAKDARVIGAPRGSGPATASVTPAASSPAPVLPRLAPGSAPDGTDVGRDVLAALGIDGPTNDPQVDSTAVGRSVIDALQPSTPVAPGESDLPAALKVTPKITTKADAKRDSKAEAKAAALAKEREKSAARAARAAEKAAARERPKQRGRNAGPVIRMTDRPTTPSTTVGARPAKPAPAPLPGSGQPQIQRGRWTEPEENRTVLQASTDVDFPVRSGVRRTLGWLLLAAFVGACIAAWFAYDLRTTGAIGSAGILGFLTMVIWAVRASCTTTQLSVRRGRLTIRRGGRSEIVDLAGDFTPIAIVGEPGHRRWTVLIERSGLPLVVINASMVDPHWFTATLYRIRPELRPDHRSLEAAGRVTASS